MNNKTYNHHLINDDLAKNKLIPLLPFLLS